jgi:hypothetical protein
VVRRPVSATGRRNGLGPRHAPAMAFAHFPAVAGLQRAVPYQFALTYAVFAVMLLLLSLSKESKEPPPADLEHPGVAA